jgi:hypothetical protein
MGPSTRSGKRGHKGISKKTEEGIENALAEAMTDPSAPTYREHSKRSRLEEFVDRVGNKARQLEDKAAEGRGTKSYREGAEMRRVEEFRAGGEVRAGDVRYNSKRGKCY